MSLLQLLNLSNLDWTTMDCFSFLSICSGSSGTLEFWLEFALNFETGTRRISNRLDWSKRRSKNMRVHSSIDTTANLNLFEHSWEHYENLESINCVCLWIWSWNAPVLRRRWGSPGDFIIVFLLCFRTELMSNLKVYCNLPLGNN